MGFTVWTVSEIVLRPLIRMRKNHRKSHGGGIPLPGWTDMQYICRMYRKEQQKHSLQKSWTDTMELYKIDVKRLDPGDDIAKWCPSHTNSTLTWWPGRGLATQDNEQQKTRNRNEKSDTVLSKYRYGGSLKRVCWPRSIKSINNCQKSFTWGGSEGLAPRGLWWWCWCSADGQA